VPGKATLIEAGGFDALAVIFQLTKRMGEPLFVFQSFTLGEAVDRDVLGARGA
jgi:hypothetical protein